MKRHSSRSYFSLVERTVGHAILAKKGARCLFKVGQPGLHVLAVLTFLLLGNRVAWAQSPPTPDAITAITKAAPLPPVMTVEDRLPYLRKLKSFLEEDPLDMAEFERQFDLKLECRPWQSTGKVCNYRTGLVRWPYSVYDEPTNKVIYSFFGDGSDDSLWINLLYGNNPGSHNCLTGTMVRQVFSPPEWTAVVDTAVSHVPSPHPSEVQLLAMHGYDRQRRHITIVTSGVTRCTGTLQISVHPNTP